MGELLGLAYTELGTLFKRFYTNFNSIPTQMEAKRAPFLNFQVTQGYISSIIGDNFMKTNYSGIYPSRNQTHLVLFFSLNLGKDLGEFGACVGR